MTFKTIKWDENNEKYIVDLEEIAENYWNIDYVQFEDMLFEKFGLEHEEFIADFLEKIALHIADKLQPYPEEYDGNGCDVSDSIPCGHCGSCIMNGNYDRDDVAGYR